MKYCWLSLMVLLLLGVRPVPAQDMAAVSPEPAAGPPEGAAVGPMPSEKRLVKPLNRPFRSIVLEARVGSGGAGFEVATPLASFLDLRAGAQFFDDIVQIKANGIQIAGDITLQNVEASVDVYPFRHSGFRISPGITIHNDNHIAGPLNIGPGQAFSLGDTDYTSSMTDPVYGFARLRFGGTVAPRFTVGYGNLFPHSGRRFSVPVEAGFEYTSLPTLTIGLGGTACTAQGCGPIDDPGNAAALQTEVQELQSDLATLRFFPVVAIGIAYKFGH